MFLWMFQSFAIFIRLCYFFLVVVVVIIYMLLSVFLSSWRECLLPSFHPCNKLSFVLFLYFGSLCTEFRLCPIRSLFIVVLLPFFEYKIYRIVLLFLNIKFISVFFVCYSACLLLLLLCQTIFVERCWYRILFGFVRS